MANIFNLPEATGVSDNDYIYISGLTNGDRRIKAEKLVGGDPVLVTKSITENGTYNASSDDAEGYSSVTVNVPASMPPTYFNLDNKLIADGDGTSSGSYMTAYLDNNLTSGKFYVYSINDTTLSIKTSGVFYYEGGSQDISFQVSTRRYKLRVSTTTASMAEYSGNYRPIYANISEMLYNSDQFYS